MAGMAGLSFGAAIPQSVYPTSAGLSANESLNVGLIGCRNIGFHNLTAHLRQPGIRCIALCDVDRNILESRATDVEKMTGEKPACDIETGWRAAVFTHLGNIAYRTGRKLRYDPQKNRFPDDPGANEYIVPEYRDPWELPCI